MSNGMSLLVLVKALHNSCMCGSNNQNFWKELLFGVNCNLVIRDKITTVSFTVFKF